MVLILRTSGLPLTLRAYPADTSQILLEPFTYLSANPGKEIRTKLIDAFNLWLRVPEDDLEVIRRVVRMLHNGSLLSVHLLSKGFEGIDRVG
jgi:geranylgeranyl diphosphate synthase type 3